MRILGDAWNLEKLPAPSVVTIGNFDGIHRGQLSVIEKVVAQAERLDLPSIVVTFEPHPLDVLRPERPPERITLRRQKHRLIELAGVDFLAEVKFTHEFAATPAEDFVRDFLHRKLDAREIYVGSKFGFGRDREGDLDLLQRLGASLGFHAEGMEEEACEEGTISSTKIRRAIRDGRVAAAARMLGRSFAVVGEVVHGEGRGKRQGWPTINVDVAHTLMPAEGVYASQVWLPGLDRQVDGVTNIGCRPTFPGSREVVVETHLFEFRQQVYGEAVELAFAHRIRGERKFESVEALSRQIANDAGEAREYLSRKDCSHIVPTL